MTRPMLAAVGLAVAAAGPAAGQTYTFFRNSTGLPGATAATTLTFDEVQPVPSPGTAITTQYQAEGVAFTIVNPSVGAGPLFNPEAFTQQSQLNGSNNIDLTLVGNFRAGFTSSDFSIRFTQPVSAAAFAFVTASTGGADLAVTARLNGVGQQSNTFTYSGGQGPGFTDNYLGVSVAGGAFDELFVGRPTTFDGAMLVDNVQFTPVPEPAAVLAVAAAGLAVLARRRARRA